MILFISNFVFYMHIHIVSVVVASSSFVVAPLVRSRCHDTNRKLSECRDRRKRTVVAYRAYRKYARTDNNVRAESQHIFPSKRRKKKDRVGRVSSVMIINISLRQASERVLKDKDFVFPNAISFISSWLRFLNDSI